MSIAPVGARGIAERGAVTLTRAPRFPLPLREGWGEGSS